MSKTNTIKKVAIVGAGGNSGTFMTQELLKTGKFTVTSITRTDSQSKLPEGVVVKKVDYNNISSLTDILKGQDALIITVGGMASPEIQKKLIQAAGDASVPWIFPNEWSPDTAHEGLCKDVKPFADKKDFREQIANLPKSSYIAVATGFWYEMMLGMGPATFGFNFKQQTVEFFDEGETKVCLSTWPQVGRAVAGLLSLPIEPEGGDSDRCLARFRNKYVYVNSFTVNQKEILDSAVRVTGTKIEDWKVSKIPAKQRYDEGMEAVKKGDHMGFARSMATRVFFNDGNGDFGKTKGTVNEMLGLPIDDIDEATGRAIERSKKPLW